MSLPGPQPPLRLDWLASEPQGSACLHAPSAEITSAHHHTQLLYVGFAGRIRSSGSHYTASACLTERSPSSRGCFKVTGCWREPNLSLLRVLQRCLLPSAVMSLRLWGHPKRYLSVPARLMGSCGRFRLTLLHPGMPICLLYTEPLPLLLSRGAVYLERVPVHSLHSRLGLGISSIGRHFQWGSSLQCIRAAQNKPTPHHLVTQSYEAAVSTGVTVWRVTV